MTSILLAAALLAADPTGLPWRDEAWPVIEAGKGYTIYRNPQGERRVILHGFGMRSSMSAGGSVRGEWRQYKTWHYQIDQWGRRYGERQIENYHANYLDAH